MPDFSRLRFLLAVGSLLLVVSLCTACIPDQKEAARLEARMSEQVEIAENITTYWSDSAKLRVLLRAPIMENVLEMKDPHQRFPEGLRVTFLDDSGDTTSILTAKYGIYRERSNEVVVSDSVVWQSTDQQKLETDELTWNEQSQRIETDRFVVITQPDYIIYGYGMTAKQDFSDVRIKQVNGRVPVNRPTE